MQELVGFDDAPEREFAEESSPILAAAEGEAEARALAEVEKDAERNEKPSRRGRD